MPLPYMFFYNQPAPVCNDQGIKLCRGMLANYDNYISTFVFFVTVQGNGSIVNYAPSIVANNNVGECDTFSRAGYLGTAPQFLNWEPGVRNWSPTGNTGFGFRIVNPDPLTNNVLWSCGIPKDKVVTSCRTNPNNCTAGESFYQFMQQIAYTGDLNITVRWQLTGIDLNVFTGTTQCVSDPQEPNFTVTGLTSTSQTQTSALTSTSTSTSTSTVPSTQTSTSTSTSTVPSTQTSTSTVTSAPTQPSSTAAPTSSAASCQPQLYQVCDYLSALACCDTNARCARHQKSDTCVFVNNTDCAESQLLAQSNWLCIPRV